MHLLLDTSTLSAAAGFSSSTTERFLSEAASLLSGGWATHRLNFPNPSDTRIIEGKDPFHSFVAASVSGLSVSRRTIGSLPSINLLWFGAALYETYMGSLRQGMFGIDSLIFPQCTSTSNIINIINLARCRFRKHELGHG